MATKRKLKKKKNSRPAVRPATSDGDGREILQPCDGEGPRGASLNVFGTLLLFQGTHLWLNLAVVVAVHLNRGAGRRGVRAIGAVVARVALVVVVVLLVVAHLLVPQLEALLLQRLDFRLLLWVEVTLENDHQVLHLFFVDRRELLLHQMLQPVLLRASPRVLKRGIFA